MVTYGNFMNRRWT
jgi:hypothetical protein